MPAPLLNTRLVVLNDIYMMPDFGSCKATEDRRGEREQLAWLQNELDRAQKKKQRVWVLGHLPPSINAGSSLSGHGSFCSGNRTVRFQDTEALANEMTEHADTITLGIFGHTHMDEFHVLAGKNSAVPIKVVASLSPVDGNLPSFTVGVIDVASATLADYSVYEASNRTGDGTTWTQEYDFNSAYNEQGFTAASLIDLTSRLRADKEGTGVESRAYQAHFLKGSSGKKLSSSWQGYVCSLDHSASEDFKTCVCKNP
jgi:sphingomyelin phosphodiesterase acid-like 3